MGILTPRRLAVPTGQNRGQLRAHPRMLRMSGARVNCRSLLPCWSGRSSPKTRHSRCAWYESP